MPNSNQMPKPMKPNKTYANWDAVIPANVRYDDRLKPAEILLFGEISALTRNTGYCWASNDYFKKYLNVTDRTIQRYIRNLKECGHIFVVHPDNSTRRIYRKDTIQQWKRERRGKNTSSAVTPDTDVTHPPTTMSQGGDNSVTHTNLKNLSNKDNKTNNSAGAGEGQQGELVSHPMQDFIDENCPNIQKIEKQLTFKEAQKLKKKFPSRLIQKKIEALENRKGSHKDYTRVYLTLKNWCEMEIERNPKKYNSNDRTKSAKSAADKGAAAFKLDIED